MEVISKNVADSPDRNSDGPAARSASGWLRRGSIDRLGDDDLPLAIRWTEPAEVDPSVAVLIVPPPGYAHSASVHAWRQLSDALADDGIASCRLDLFGTGDSPGASGDVSSWAQWQRSLRRGIDHVASLGAQRVVLVGSVLSGDLVLQARSDAVVGKVALDPVASGRRRVRQLRLLGESYPEGSGDLSVAGTVFRASLLQDIAAVRPVHQADVSTLVLESHDGGFEQLSAEWSTLDERTHDYRLVEHVANFLERPAEEATVDDTTIHAISSWIRSALAPLRVDTPSRPHAANRSAAVERGEQRTVTEEFVSIGQSRLAGVLSTERGKPRPTSVVVFLNSGSDPHTGPGRAWVEFARALATPDRAILRLDCRGWGDSPPGPSGPGRPYDRHAADDIRDVLMALRADGWRHISLVGLCAGAWLALRAACNEDVDCVVALNPQMYWQPGDPIDALMSTTRARRLSEISAIARIAATGRWDEEDARGMRPPAGRWLDSLAAQKIPITLVFAENDDGIEYLRDRLSRRLQDVVDQGNVRVVEIPGIDHSMQRVWLRPRMLQTLDEGLSGPAVDVVREAGGCR